MSHVSTDLEAAALRQIERDNLGDIVAAYEDEHGSLEEERVARKAALLAGDSSAGVE